MEQEFVQSFENLNIQQEEGRKKGKNEFTSKGIVKKAMYVYGMIISVKLQHINKINSDGDLE